jgi:hypothetical protein
MFAANTGSAALRFIGRKARYSGLDVSDAKRFKVLEAENAKLKKLLAEAMLITAQLTGTAMLRFSQERQIAWHYIAPGKPTRNAFIE